MKKMHFSLTLHKCLIDAYRVYFQGIKVKELWYEDGSCPPPKILKNFLALANKERCLAVHCKAGWIRRAH